MDSYTLSRIGIAFIWLYHGLIPKLIFRDPTELELVSNGPIIHSALTTVILAGIGEVILGILVLLFWSHRWPAYLSIVLFSGLLIGGVAVDAGLAVEAFNPVTLSGSAILFGLINLNSPQPIANRLNR